MGRRLTISPRAKRAWIGAAIWLRRVLRTVGWVLVTLGLAVSVLWLASGWYQVSVRTRGGLMLASGGALTIDGEPFKGGVQTAVRSIETSAQVIPKERPRWTFWRWFHVPGGSYTRVGLGPIALALVVAGIVARLLGYMTIRGHCLECGYDLRGLQQGVCPECGTVSRRGGAKEAGASVSQPMSNPPPESKADMRSRIAGVLRKKTRDAVASESERACSMALQAGVFPAGATVMVYAPIEGVPEIDLTGLAEGLAGRGCRVCVPRVDAASRLMTAVAVRNLTTDLAADVASGLRGVRTARPGAPEVPAGEVDVVVVPGVAFDRLGGRLGRGAGYYDRFLAGLGGRARRVAIAFEEQVVDRVPMEAHDQRVHVLVTPAAVVEVSGGARE